MRSPPGGAPELRPKEHHCTSNFEGDIVQVNVPGLDVNIPGITNIHLSIPTITASTVSVNASPLPLHLDNAIANQIHATNATLPVGGFSIAGLSLNSVDGTAIAVPDAHLDSATINHF